MTFDAHAYLDAAAAAIGLPIPAESRDAVAGNLARLAALAQQVMDFEPPADSPTDTLRET